MSDPSAEPMDLGLNGGTEPINTDALYLSDSGLLNGVAQGYPEMGFAIVHDGERLLARPTLRDQLFVVDLSGLADGDVLEVRAFAGDGSVLASGETTFRNADVRPVGASATDR